MKKNRILREDSESLEIEIIFNVNKNGHDFNYKRYDQKLYEQMINAPQTQRRIKNGYALGGYTHEERNPRKMYQVDGTVCLKTLKMEYLGDGNVLHVQRIVKNEVGKEIAILLKNGVGGFSSVHHLKTKKFAGFDYVHYPMFAGNKLVHDNTCQNGVCGFDMDSIFTNVNIGVEAEARKKGYSLEVSKALTKLEEGVLKNSPYFQDMQKAKLEIVLLKRELEERNRRHEAYKKTIKKHKKALGLSKKWEIKSPQSYDFKELQEEISEEYREIKKALENGIQFQNKATTTRKQKILLG